MSSTHSKILDIKCNTTLRLNKLLSRRAVNGKLSAPWSRVLHEKLVFTQLVKKSPRMFIAVFTNPATVPYPEQHDEWKKKYRVL